MVNVVQGVLALLSLFPFRSSPEDFRQSAELLSRNKSIAIVGAGSAGLAAVRAILDLPLETRQFWSIVVFEQRRDVGGIWLPDPVPPHPPALPSTPLYPRLHTNTPHPIMTVPGLPFPPMTALFPSHEHVLAYHRDFAEKFGLGDYIRFNTTVLVASWQEQGSSGVWNVQTQHHLEGNFQNSVETHQFDHLIVASGHNHYPVIPDIPGSQMWLDNTPPASPTRSILHSIFYRNPDDYVNQTVVVVGGGASGLDTATQLASIARKVYLSSKENTTIYPVPDTIILRPRISYFSRYGPVFIDNTSAVDVDAVILATGYELRFPFLDAGGVLQTDPHARSNNSDKSYTGLTTNLRYLFPLHEMTFSICSKLPPTALSFIGLPILVLNLPTSHVQGLFVAHAIANSSLLPPRDHLLAQLARYEADLVSQGFDPYYVGHRLVGKGAPDAYQDRIVQFLKDNGALPYDENKYVDQWRRDALRDLLLLKRAWARIESGGREEERKWIKGVTTEEDWARLLYRVARWQREYEEGRGEVYHDMYNNII